MGAAIRTAMCIGICTDLVLNVTGWDAAKVRETMDKATAKVESLKEFDVKKDPEHVCSVMAYTDETKLYGKLNMSTHLTML